MIYKDCIGNLESRATISVFGGMFEKEYYALSTTIKGIPSKKWSIDTTISDIIDEMSSDGWDCVVRKNGYNKPVIKCVHRETQAAIEDASHSQREQFVGAEKGYIRFGKSPEGGKSLNHRDNTLEAGVSCFRAEFATDGSYRLILSPELQVSYLTVMGRDAYRLYGDEVGIGSDGEPLLMVEKEHKL